MAEYKRPKLIADSPSGYCPGCLHSLATKLIAEVIEEMGQADNSLNVISVGCSALNILYWGGDFLSVAHGRAPAAATGIKRSNPERLVFAYQGDGDLAAIGLAEIISAANRGEHFTVIFANNQTYGMTGGQMAPTTLIGQKTTTSVYGRDPETTGYPFKMCELISQLEAPAYVARFALNSPKGIMDAKKGIRKAFEYQMADKGFTFVELLTNCPTNWKMTPLQTLDYMNTNTIPYFKPGVYKDKEADK
ncbi:MAG: thiamine pyrophosphate-dependent enzyme [Oscillospiraceae bacterium]|nr:thiamine pyrophosphate-dependent enzyme [Oscillospiraceae bacterium]MDD7354628.1 thiamine pyrophosphate-dependent enzyme [Oscillospiraceae bacterium]MDY3938162.1 thiamine pyrophosphate-dependent enzyme [Oscillospiraceae bacterium]